jgi:SAM-dependent methyltransferase
MIVEARVPAYFDDLIEGFHRGRGTRFVHLGYWDLPLAPDAGKTADDFGRAQERLDLEVMSLARVMDGQSVLDVGCGFGGTIENINTRFSGMRLTGINVDPRQLDICSQLEPRRGNDLLWRHADACALPFDDESFDLVCCIEAMFHFSSRRAFFCEAARVLRRGGAMVCSDIAIDASARGRSTPAFDIAASLQSAYGPWPDIWGDDADHGRLADAAGLRPGPARDLSANTLPSHRFTTPEAAGDWIDSEDAGLRAAMMLRWLHSEHLLRYLCFRFDKPAR